MEKTARFTNERTSQVYLLVLSNVDEPLGVVRAYEGAT